MTRRRFDGKTVIVTGAARGLGKALCRRFAQAGARVGGIDVLAAELAATGDEIRAAGLTMETAACDLTGEAATFDAFRDLRDRLGPVDVLINNAGITHIERFGAGGAAAVRRVMEVNFLGAVHATAAAFDDLVAGGGMIVVISSVTGYAPLVARGGYCASKHALHGFFDTLRAELRDDGVGVLMVCPSSIATGIRDGYDTARAAGAEATPAAVAGRIFAAAERRKRRLATGRVGKLAFWVHRFAPRLYEILMIRAAGGGS